MNWKPQVGELNIKEKELQKKFKLEEKWQNKIDTTLMEIGSEEKKKFKSKRIEVFLVFGSTCRSIIYNKSYSNRSLKN
jgi:hypothetical protein